jgi:hypothetical protein
MRKVPHTIKSTSFPKLMKRIGMWIENTDFNRRAAKFAEEARQEDNSRKQRINIKLANKEMD